MTASLPEQRYLTLRAAPLRARVVVEGEITDGS